MIFNGKGEFSPFPSFCVLDVKRLIFSEKVFEIIVDIFRKIVYNQYRK